MTEKALENAQETLLVSKGLEQSHIDTALSLLLGPGVGGGDLYFQKSHQETWALEDGIVKEAGFHVDQGLGIRAISGERAGFAYSNEIVPPALFAASKTARAIAKAGENHAVQIAPRHQTPSLYTTKEPGSNLLVKEKLDLLYEVDRVARQADPRVAEVMTSLSGNHETVLIVTQDGSISADIRPLVRLNVTVIVAQGKRREQGTSGSGGRYGFHEFIAKGEAGRLAREAVRQALVNLEAQAAPAGEMVVVLGPGWPGILLHEAIGHGLEGDFNRKGTSAFAGRIGEIVASRGVTVVDDGTLEKRRGSLNIDDEGTPTQRTVLIEDGKLQCYMQDRMNASLMKVPLTGNGRRESYSHSPMPRMTNTYMLPGDSTPEEIIASVKKGVYAVNFSGGQVDITSGKFVFSASEAYRIENGKLGKPIKGATLIGNGPDVLTRVTMIGNDLKLDEGVGTCGKEGQLVPVGVGQPTIKINGLTVGGTST